MQYNPEEFIEILNIFKAESEEIIQELNDGFLLLEKNPEDKAPLKKLFQLAHSLKGAARMLGFNSIQDIAHKLEDILSIWKKEESKIDKDSFQVIYEVCDSLGDLINKSVMQKSDYSDEQVMLFLNKLDNFLTSNRMVKVEQTQGDSKKYLIQKNTDINALLLELMFVLERDEESDDDEIMLVVLDNLNQLFDIFKNTDFSNIKVRIKNILDNIQTNTDKEDKFSICIAEVNDLKAEIYTVYKELGISFSPAKVQPEHQEEQQEKDKSDSIEVIAAKYDLLLQSLPKIKYEKTHISEINKQLEELVTLSQNQRIELIISKTLNILRLLQTKNIVIDNDCYMVILQCIYLAKRMSLNEKEENSNNLDFLVQRLSVIEDMFKISDIKQIETLKNVKSQTGVVSGADKDLELIKKNLNMFELQEIKTMRVDTTKLDNLISQTGELLVNGIRTREHLSELSVINSKLVQWNSASKKIINYLKYLEKKGFFLSAADDSISMFYKKAQSFFQNNAEMVSDIQSDFGRLYNIISEDDNKLHQTAMEIESIAKGIRVLPLATIFHSFPRMMRDIAIENKKKIDFIVSGSDTTVDKKLIEEIKMPLIHILRNAVSHGIEVPEERLNNGKKEVGTVRLIAKQIENNVVISIEDDGYGINLEKIKQTAIKKGMLFEDEVENISNEQLMKLLFLPGFSTEDSINELSGRGIGLDIVKTKINNLNGDISIDSVLNKGCKVTIKLPVSMSTIKTFVIMVNEQKYAIPVNSIKFVKRINKDEIFSKNGQNCIIYDDHSIPIYSLSEVFGESTEKLVKEKQLTVIIIENQDREVAFIIDKLLGDHEVFHKKLEAPVVKIKNISGYTTLSTGEICLIINPYELIRNTVSGNYLPSFDIKKLLTVEEHMDIKNVQTIIYDDDDLEFVRKDISNDFENLISFNNIFSIYDYIQKNDADIFICKLTQENTDLLRLIKYIKNDEILSKTKLVIISDLTAFDVLNLLEDSKPDVYLKTSDYDKERFLGLIRQIL